MASARTLADEIANGPLSVQRVVVVVRAVLDALGDGHDRGVLQRVLTPAQVVLTEAGVMLTGADAGEVIAPYAAPECAVGEPPTVRSDLYAVGVIAYESLTGTCPFDGGNAVAVAYAARHASSRPLRVLRPDVPADVAAVVGRAIARLPDDRFVSAPEFAEALEDAAVDGFLSMEDTIAPVEEMVPVDVSAVSRRARVLGVPRRAVPRSRHRRAMVGGTLG